MYMKNTFIKSFLNKAAFYFSFSIILLCFGLIKSSSAQAPILVTNTSGITKMEKAGTQVYFFKTVDSSGVYIQELWTLGTTLTSAAKVRSFGEVNSPYGAVTLTKDVNGLLHFVISHSSLGEQLWVSDGTAAGTLLLFTCSKIYAFFDFNNSLYFSAFSYTNAAINGMYTTNGTLAGTTLLKNIQTRYSGTFVYEGIYFYTKFNNKIIFAVQKGVPNNPTTHYVELWSTDGTASGFVKLDSLYGAIDVYQNTSMPEYNGELYFRFLNKANNNTSEVWRTNGTVNNSSYFYTLGISSQISPILVYNNKLFLGAFDSGTGFELYTTDGTIPGTSLLKNINASPSFFGSDPTNFNITCGKLFFLAKDSGNTSRRIWLTDGTGTGTIPHTIPRGTYSLISKLANGVLYYAYLDNNLDSVKIFMVDSVNCNSSQILSWSYVDYGYVSQVVQLNPLFVSLNGGIAGGQGIYALGAGATGVQGPTKSTSINIFPNPVMNSLTISSSDEIAVVEIYNMIGEIVHQSRPANKQTNIDLSKHAKGVYFVKVYDKSQVYSQKIIVQ